LSYITVHDLAFSYGARTVLQGVDLTLRKGELAVLVGPNGCGKSTLIRLMTRVIRPQRGRVVVGGFEELAPAALARCVAVVPQDTAVEFDFTGFEMVLMGRAPHIGPLGRETEHDLAVVREALELTGTAHLADRSIQQISGGERQRLIIDSDLSQQTEALLLDDPTSHNYIKQHAYVLELVLRLCRQRSMATLAVLHDLNLAATYADRIFVLSDGRIVADGPTGEVITTDTIQDVFQVHPLLIRHPENGMPVVLMHAAQGNSVAAQNIR
jgi:iron complex transport system ATP-binding protein